MFIFYFKNDVNTQICYDPQGPGKMPKISVILQDCILCHPRLGHFTFCSSLPQSPLPLAPSEVKGNAGVNMTL